MEPTNGRAVATDATREFAHFLQINRERLERPGEAMTLKAWTELAETYRITQVLRECKGNRSAAARVLGIGRRTLYAKMEKLGISATWRIGGE